MIATPDNIQIGEPMPRLGSVSASSGYEIRVSWVAGPRQGRTDTVDLAPVLLAYKFYRPLRENPGLLKTVRAIDDGAAIAWGDDDELDMAATTVERLTFARDWNGTASRSTPPPRNSASAGGSWLITRAGAASHASSRSPADESMVLTRGTSGRK